MINTEMESFLKKKQHRFKVWERYRIVNVKKRPVLQVDVEIVQHHFCKRR